MVTPQSTRKRGRRNNAARVYDRALCLLYEAWEVLDRGNTAESGDTPHHLFNLGHFIDYLTRRSGRKR